MKKLGKLQINPEKLMKNEELVAFKGGYGNHYVSCRLDNVECWGGAIENCDASAVWACNTFCLEGWDSLICTG
jgi:hypothetical protein